MKKLNYLLIATAVTTLVTSPYAHAASGTWTGATDAIWADSNWSATPVPGTGDTATFSGNSATVNAHTTISLGTGVTINTILFDTSSAAAYTIGSGAVNSQTLTLNDNGAVTMNSTVANNELFNSALILGTDGATQSTTITNNSTTNTLTFAGTVTGSTGAGVKTLNIAGGGSTTISGAIGNGTTGTVAVAVNTTDGKTTLGTNSFSGGFTLTGGTVVATNTQSLGSLSTAIDLNGGILDIDSTTGTGTQSFGSTTVTNSGYNTVVGGNVEIISDRPTSGAGIQYLLGTLSIGADTLTVTDGANDTSAGRIQFGATTLTGNAVLDAENNALLVVGAGGASAGLSGNFNLTVQSADGTGGTSVRGGVNGSSPRTSGVTTFSSGKNNINGAGGTDILGTTGTSLVLNGGSLDIQVTVSSILAYPTTVGGNFTLTNAETIAENLGSLSIGAYNLTTGGSAASGAENLGFGATTFTGNATFTVQNFAGTGTAGSSTSTLTLGALNDGGSAYTITKAGGSTLVLNGATANLTANDLFEVSAGTLSATNATALGGTATGVTVDVADGAVYNVGASQTVGALTNTSGTHTANSGSVTLGANTLTIGNSTTNLGGTFGGVISGTGGIAKGGSATETLSGANTYSGVTTINGGVLSVGTLATEGSGGGTASGIGQSGNAAGNLVLNGGTLQYTGGTVSTDRLFTVGTATSGATGTIDASGSGAVNFNNAGAILYGTAGTTATAQTRTLVLTGSNTGANTLAAVIGNNGTAVNGNSAVNVTKNGVGTWILSNTNTYTGATTVNNGTLIVSGSTAAGSAVAINNGGTLGGASLANEGTLSGTVTVAGGGAINLQDGTIGTLHTGALTLGGGTASALSFDLGAGGTGNLDEISAAGTLTMNGSTTINLGYVSGTPSLTAGLYTLIGYTGTTLNSTQFGNFTLNASALAGSGDSFSLVNGTDGIELQITTGGPPATAYYTGSTSTDINTPGNFVTTHGGGTTTSSAIGSNTDVYLTADTASNETPTLNSGTGTTINSLTFTGAGTSASAGVILNGSKTLTIGGGSGTNTPGIYVQSGSGTDTINAPVALGVSQTWSNSASTLLTVSGGVSGTGALGLQANSTGGIAITTGAVNHIGSITNSGSGSGITTISANIGSNVTTVTQSSSTSPLVLTGNNTYSGNTSVTAGKLYVANSSGSGTSSGTVTVSNSGSMLAGSGGTISGGVTLNAGTSLYSGGVPTGTPTVGAGTGLTLSSSLGVNSANLTFALGSGGSAAPYAYGAPNTNSSYLNVTGNTAGEISFTGTDSISIVDLTGGSLTLRQGTPYLLIQAGSSSDYSGLITEQGFGATATYSLDGTGYVVGVLSAAGIAANYTGGNLASLDPSYYTPIAINQYGADGVNPLSGSDVYAAPALYLNGGDLEVVPEPGTWALMLGGLVLLVVIQHRRKLS